MEALLEEIEKLKTSNTLIIVEGKKDISALRNLGLKNVVEINGNIYEFAESIKEDEVVILTDLDPEGKKLYSKLMHYFSQKGIKINNKLRNILFKETKLRQIEGIDTYLENNS